MIPRAWFATTLAVVTFVLIAVRAVRTADGYWDTLAYHWPYAARVAGICDRDCFLLNRTMELRYDGFPLLLHAAQGLLWRLTGGPGIADLINIGSLVALGAYLAWRFKVPLAWSWLAFLAIPEVQIQLTSSYIDVPVNAAITLGILVVLRMLIQPKADQRADIALALVALAVAANSKYQAVPIALLVWSGAVVLAQRHPAGVGFERRFTTCAVLVLVGASALLPKLVTNTIAFGNPFHPVDIIFGPLHFPGSEIIIGSSTISDAWIAKPRPLRWVASVLEFDAFRGRTPLWTLGQGDVAQSSPSFRMGGYFVPYVLGTLALVVWSVRSTPLARWAGAVMVVLSLLCAVLPNSHELRYYLFWMLSLVSIMLAISHAPIFATEQQGIQRRFVYGLVMIALLSVITMTGAAYVRTGGPRLQDLLRETEATVAQLPDGATLCIRNRDRRAFLYASVFHPPHRYRTHVIENDEPNDGCTVRLTLEP